MFALELAVSLLLSLGLLESGELALGEDAAILGDRFGASLPRRAERVSWKSPVEIPRRYKIGRRASRLLVRRAHLGRIDEVNRIFSAALTLPRSRTLARRTATGPTPVWIARSGPWP